MYHGYEQSLNLISLANPAASQRECVCRIVQDYGSNPVAAKRSKSRNVVCETSRGLLRHEVASDELLYLTFTAVDPKVAFTQDVGAQVHYEGQRFQVLPAVRQQIGMQGPVNVLPE